jgi:hypothetical protein
MDDPGPGALVFLYSAVWTRGFEKYYDHINSVTLVTILLSFTISVFEMI